MISDTVHHAAPMTRGMMRVAFAMLVATGAKAQTGGQIVVEAGGTIRVGSGGDLATDGGRQLSAGTSDLSQILPRQFKLTTG